MVRWWAAHSPFFFVFLGDFTVSREGDGRDGSSVRQTVAHVNKSLEKWEVKSPPTSLLEEEKLRVGSSSSRHLGGETKEKHGNNPDLLCLWSWFMIIIIYISACSLMKRPVKKEYNYSAVSSIATNFWWARGCLFFQAFVRIFLKSLG